jgi:hypothetical protein
MSEAVVTSDTVEPPQKKVGFVKAAGVLGILGGIALIVVGLVVWVMVSSQLRAENITVPDDAMAFQGQTVAGPFTAYVQADIIQHHALKISGGKTYAELAGRPGARHHDERRSCGRRCSPRSCRSASPRSRSASASCRSCSAPRWPGWRRYRSSSDGRPSPAPDRETGPRASAGPFRLRRHSP